MYRRGTAPTPQSWEYVNRLIWKVPEIPRGDSQNRAGLAIERFLAAPMAGMDIGLHRDDSARGCTKPDSFSQAARTAGAGTSIIRIFLRGFALCGW
jgi:hypothetical protein